jgi:hypothetical protein
MAMASPGMTAGNASYTQPDAFQRAPFVDCFDHIMAAGWREAAIRTQQWRQGELVKANWPDKKLFKHSLKCIIPGAPSALENSIGFMRFVHPDIHDVTLIVKLIQQNGIG